MAPPLALEQLQHCFQGLLPASIATCAPDGTPNITFLSQVHYVDSRHVALSCQFFNKTRRNVERNPDAHVDLFDPLTMEMYRLRVRYTHSETEGPLYEAMSLRIQAIASVTGMDKIFRLIAADVYEVLEVEHVQQFLQQPSAARAGFGTVQPEFNLRQPLGLQIVSQQINRARDLEQMLQVLLQTLDQVCGFRHSMMLVPDEGGRRLVAIASRGYDEVRDPERVPSPPRWAARGEAALRPTRMPGRTGIGAEVTVGEGFIGTAAAEQKVLRVSGVEAELRYGRAIRQRMESAGHGAALRPEIPMPGLAGAQSHLALPLVVQDRLVGVLALESRDPFAFGTWDEALLQMLANQIAVVLDRNATPDDEEVAATGKSVAPAPAVPADGSPRRSFTFFRNDDCVFVDGEYLIRNVPGKILWKLLNAYQRDGRTEFTNRELRLDPGLGLPPVKNNLESRLILLRRRLEEQCPDVKLVPVRRGRFALEVHCPLALLERDTA